MVGPARLLAYAAWCAFVSAGAGGVRPPELSVPLCCPAGHALAPEALQAAALTAGAAAAWCRPVPHAPAFAPLVYAPARGTFLGRGKLPAHWHLADAALPNCTELRVLTEHAAPYALLANNGSLLLRETRRALSLERYCVDAAGALVCLEDSALPPSKCCVEGQTFDGAHCVEDRERAAVALDELRTLANGSALGFGFPACPGPAGSSYSVVGALITARLEENGALALGGDAEGERLAAGAWCAEATSGETGARVLACEAAAHAARPARSARHLLYGAGLAVGAAFLAATLVAGFALPAAHHALHWRCQTHYVAALMLGDVLLAATQLAGDSVPETPCRMLGERRFSHLVLE